MSNLNITHQQSVTTICYSPTSHRRYSSASLSHSPSFHSSAFRYIFASVSRPPSFHSSAAFSVISIQMSSSEDKPMNTRDFRLVYVRRRRRNTTGSGIAVRDLDLNLPPPSEPSLHKTYGSFEIGDDTPLSPAPNLFQRAAFIPRWNRSNINRKPRRYREATLSPPPSSDHHQASSAVASAPNKKWRCPTCLRRIDDDELSKPIIQLKQLKLKNIIKKSEE